MTFEEWLNKNYPDDTDNKFGWNIDQLKFAYESALEEAAKWADMTGPLNAKEIRSLKEGTNG